MFMPEDETIALPMMFLLLFFWGTWTACRKISGTGVIEFMLAMVLASACNILLIFATFGMLVPSNSMHFNHLTSVGVLGKDLMERPFAIALTMLGGGCLITALFLTSLSIDKLGLAVACPIWSGVSLSIATSVSYVLEPRADPRLLFPSVMLTIVGVCLNAMSMSEERKGGDASPSPNAVAAADCKHPSNISFATTIALLAYVKDRLELVSLPIVAGIVDSAWYGCTTTAAIWGKLHPYTILFAFAVGETITIFPLACIYAAWAQPQLLVSAREFSVACTTLMHFGRWLWTAPRGSRAWTVLSGIFVSSGFFLFFMGTPVVSRAVGVVFACSSSVINIICGAFIFKEYQGAPAVKKVQATGAVVSFTLSISLMCVASAAETSD